jgi:hypothetical protein
MGMSKREQNQRLGKPIVSDWPTAKLRPVPMKGYISIGLDSRNGSDHRGMFVDWLHENYGILPATSDHDWEEINRWVRSRSFRPWLKRNEGVPGLLNMAGLSDVSTGRVNDMFDNIRVIQGPWRIRAERDNSHPVHAGPSKLESTIPEPPFLEFAKTLRDVCDKFVGMYEPK